MGIKNKSDASCFVFSLPKAGSSLANALVRDLGVEAGMTYRSIMDEYFAKGIADADIPLDVGRTLEAKGYVYGGFRYLLPGLEVPILETSQKIFLVRDPRDILVSWFFSIRQSHVLPGQVGDSELKDRFLKAREKALELDIDDWVLRKTRGLIELLLSYRSVLGNPLTKIYRYEDVIFEKSAWATDIANHFGWDIPAARCSEIAQRHDIRVDVEDPSRHIRNVTPGDHKNKLSAATITELNRRLRPFLEAFRYADAAEYYLDAIELFNDQLRQRVACILVEEISTNNIADIKSFPLSKNDESEFIDDGSIECLSYWLERDDTYEGDLKPDRPFQVCYVLRFHQPVSDVVLGTSVYHAGTEEQFGRNTMEFGPLSFKAGSCILVKWHFSGLPYAGEYWASVGVSSHATGAFHLRQYRMRTFSLSE